MSTDVRKVVFSGFAFWVALAAIGLYLIMPLRQKLRFGIDLVGGTYITLEVQTDKAVDSELIEYMQRIKTKLKKLKLEAPTSAVVEQKAITFTFASPAAVNAASDQIRTNFLGERTGLEQKVQEMTIRLQFNERKEEKIKRAAVAGNIKVLRARLDKMSVAEITIAEQGDKNIIIELPDVADPQQAKAMIGKSAKLEFKIVDRYGSSPEDILYEIGEDLPKDKEILPGKQENEFYLVSKYSDITGALLKDSYPGLGGDTGAEQVVHFVFSPEGGDKFYKLTSRNYGKQLAVVLDGIVITAPGIKTGIRSEGYITGMRSPQEARDLASFLKSGAFVAPVTFEEERQIASTLGAESIRQGVISCLVGLGLVFLFSLYYYKLSGLLAFLALLYNMFLILVGMAWLRATLTLPGIAGMVLTIGMAIDASILIFERIKEELASGITVKKAVNLGFANAMKVILDANITTFIAGIVLYKFGTGPIQGFAVTMMFGIIATLITGLFFLRALFNLILDLFNVQKLSI